MYIVQTCMYMFVPAYVCFNLYKTVHIMYIHVHTCLLPFFSCLHTCMSRYKQLMLQELGAGAGAAGSSPPPPAPAAPALASHPGGPLRWRRRRHPQRQRPRCLCRPLGPRIGAWLYWSCDNRPEPPWCPRNRWSGLLVTTTWRSQASFWCMSLPSRSCDQVLVHTCCPQKEQK